MVDNSFNKIRNQNSKAILFLGLFHFFIIFVFLIFARFGLASEGGILLVQKEALNDGGLFFITDTPGLYVPAPFLKTDVQIKVNGLVARVKVIQSFTNTTNQWVEGIYTYPLPEKSAVDRLTMVIGERRVIGEIKEKAEARKAYDQENKNSQPEQQGNSFLGPVPLFYYFCFPDFRPFWPGK